MTQFDSTGGEFQQQESPPEEPHKDYRVKYARGDHRGNFSLPETRFPQPATGDPTCLASRERHPNQFKRRIESDTMYSHPGRQAL